MKPMMRIAAVAIGLACALAAGGAHGEVIERVVAVVNEDAVLLSELRTKAAPFTAEAMKAATEVERMAQIDRIYKGLLDRLVDERLMEQTARDMRVNVTAEEVGRAITTMREQNSLAEDAFWKAVRGTGMSKHQYKNDVRRQLMRLKVINQRVRGKINVSEAAVRERYDTQLRAARRTLRFHAKHVFFAVPDHATATVVAATKRRAENVRATIDAAGFDAAVKRHGGGDLGWLSQGDLPDTLEEALLTLEPGQISPVVRGPSGLHIFLLRERQRGSEALPPFEQARVPIQRELLETAMARQERAFVEEMRRKAVIEIRL
ncbi:MAG: SurA N-terminal domain-containing protein [Proteobacteria bacterium]|nr:SurA N-terminal domain-containing protein [Pseudomonadota bacterium]